MPTLATLFAAVAEEAQRIEEHVDEIQLEGQGIHDGMGPSGSLGQSDGVRLKR